ncbi:hypothetical protein BN946_scf184740.g5 [Trametes cinnabarina]|uniref:Cytochrome c oxidase assembly protein COX20, mitochondrial n=1 Tax=Pycnoporus cinnabarinus TaxID=5643 RepID=A0A060SNN9_PYCCI|nr:hypothetical protein BN946_scf184740.g5 [Trametes cinnabarina]
MSATEPMNTNASGSGASSTPGPDAPRAPKRIVYQVETTGNWWDDVKEAVKVRKPSRSAPFRDSPRTRGLAERALLSGIASGVGIGVIRGMSGSVLLACNWAVGTFMLISLGSWTICQRNREEERRRLQKVMDTIPKRFVKTDESAPSGEAKSA